MHFYSAFGQQIASEIRLPQLTPGEPPADVTVSRADGSLAGPSPGERNHRTEIVTEDELAIYRASGDLYWQVDSIGTLRVSDGSEITVAPAASATTNQLRQLVLGPGFRSLLVQQGTLVLHGSAVAIADEAVAFLGKSGSGKSTTAAAFGTSGHRVLSDDVSPVRDSPRAGRFAILPGVQSVKLHRHVARRFQQGIEPVTDATPRLEQQYYEVTETTRADEPTPINCLYLLDQGPSPTIEPATTRDLLVVLRESSPLFHQSESNLARAHFQQCAELVEGASIKRLSRPRTLDALDAVVTLVEDDVLA